MPKFTLIKHREFETDAEVSVTFSTDELGLAKDHFNDFLKASGFELPLDETMSDYVVRPISEWEWDDNGDFKINAAEMTFDGIFNSNNTDIIDFKRYRKEND